LGVAGGAGVAGAATSGVFGMSWTEIACIAILMALASSMLFLVLHGRAKRKRTAECACAPAAANSASCMVGGSFDPAQQK
jgi:hypothetical protein